MINSTFLRSVLVASVLMAGGGYAVAHDLGSATKSFAGAASWYGGKFHGRKTANGERFNQDGLTAAHRTLPFGTKLRVTYPKTGKSVVVRVNDRGPFAGKRILDLSRGAAKSIGMINSGVAKVNVEILG